MIELNVTARTRLTYGAASAFVERGVGTIIHISLVVSIAIEPLNGVYSGSATEMLRLDYSSHNQLTEKTFRV